MATVFVAKSTTILFESVGSNYLLYLFKNKIISNFVKFVATKRGRTTNIFPPPLLLLLVDPGSGIGKIQDLG
jgi:hypothetical protein